MKRQLLKVDEVAAILGLNKARVYQLTRENRIPYVLIGERQYRYSLREIEEFVDAGGNRQQKELGGENDV